MEKKRGRRKEEGEGGRRKEEKKSEISDKEQQQYTGDQLNRTRSIGACSGDWWLYWCADHDIYRQPLNDHHHERSKVA